MSTPELEVFAMAGPEIDDACNGHEGVLAALKDFNEEDISLLYEEQLLQQELVKIRKSLMFNSLNLLPLSSAEKSEMNDRLGQVFREMAALAAKKAEMLQKRVASMQNIIAPVVSKDDTSKLPAPKHRAVRISDRPRRSSQPCCAAERSTFKSWLAELSRKEDQRQDSSMAQDIARRKSFSHLKRTFKDPCEEQVKPRTPDLQ